MKGRVFVENELIMWENNSINGVQMLLILSKWYSIQFERAFLYSQPDLKYLHLTISNLRLKGKETNKG